MLPNANEAPFIRSRTAEPDERHEGEHHAAVEIQNQRLAPRGGLRWQPKNAPVVDSIRSLGTAHGLGRAKKSVGSRPLPRRRASGARKASCFSIVGTAWIL